jgi:hypothetical protein
MGTAFLMVIAALWQSWPGALEIANFSFRDRIYYRLTLTCLSALIAVQMFYSAAAIYHEYRLPYCGAKQAAPYLRTIVNRGQKIYAFDYGMNSVLAYFDHNIFQNLSELNRGASFFHHSSTNIVADRESFMTFRQTHPEYLLLICWRPPQAAELRALAASNGYVLDHVFPGQVIDKSSFGVYQTYLLYRRNDLPGPPSPVWREETNELIPN